VRRELAATSIACARRAQKCRVEAARVRTERREEEERQRQAARRLQEEKQAATEIQSLRRGQVVRKEVSERKQRRDHAAEKVAAEKTTADVTATNVFAEAAKPVTAEQNRKATEKAAAEKAAAETAAAEAAAEAAVALAAEEERKEADKVAAENAAARAAAAEAVAEAVRRELAATSIACARRAQKCRVEAARVRTERREEEERQRQAARRLQEEKQAATEIQSLRRGQVVRKEVSERKQRRDRAAKSMQCAHRQKNARDELSRRRRDRDHKFAAERDLLTCVLRHVTRSGAEAAIRKLAAGAAAEAVRKAVIVGLKTITSTAIAAEAMQLRALKEAAEEERLAKAAQKRDQAAIAIQSRRRGHRARKDIAGKRERREQENDAASKIQSFRRGRKARAHAAQLQRQKIQELHAAGVIQRCWRCELAQRKVADMEHHRQALAAVEESIDRAEREYAAVVIQCAQRRRAAAEEVSQRRTRKLQRWWEISAVVVVCRRALSVGLVAAAQRWSQKEAAQRELDDRSFAHSCRVRVIQRSVERVQERERWVQAKLVQRACIKAIAVSERRANGRHRAEFEAAAVGWTVRRVIRLSVAVAELRERHLSNAVLRVMPTTMLAEEVERVPKHGTRSNKVGLLQIEENAIIQLQSVYRGWRARENLTALKSQTGLSETGSRAHSVGSIPTPRSPSAECEEMRARTIQADAIHESHEHTYRGDASEEWPSSADAPSRSSPQTCREMRSVLAGPGASTLVGERPTITYFLTVMEERLARAVFSEEAGLVENCIAESHSSQPSRSFHRPLKGYSLVDHHCEEECRAAKQSLQCRRTRCERAAQLAATKIQRAMRGRKARAGLSGGRPDEETVAASLSQPQDGEVASSVGIPQRLPALSSQSRRPGRRLILQSQLPAAPDLTVWTPLRGQLSKAQQVGPQLVPQRPSEPPSLKTSKGGLQRPCRRRAHLTQPRCVLEFPIPNGMGVARVARPAEVDGSSVVDDDSIFRATLSSIRSATESDNGSEPLVLKPPRTSKRAPGEWSEQWVMENSWPSRFPVGALMPKMLQGPSPQCRGLHVEQSLDRPPQAVRSSTQEGGLEAGCRSEPRSSLPSPQQVASLDAAAEGETTAETSCGRSELSPHSSPFREEQVQPTLPHNRKAPKNHHSGGPRRGVHLPPVPKHRVGPVLQERVLKRRPIWECGRRSETLKWCPAESLPLHT